MVKDPKLLKEKLEEMADLFGTSLNFGEGGQHIILFRELIKHLDEGQIYHAINKLKLTFKPRGTTPYPSLADFMEFGLQRAPSEARRYVPEAKQCPACWDQDRKRNAGWLYWDMENVKTGMIGKVSYPCLCDVGEDILAKGDIPDSPNRRKVYEMVCETKEPVREEIFFVTPIRKPDGQYAFEFSSEPIWADEEKTKMVVYRRKGGADYMGALDKIANAHNKVSYRRFIRRRNKETTEKPWEGTRNEHLQVN